MRPSHSNYKLLEECLIDVDDAEMNLYARKTQCTSTTGYYAIYSNMNYNSFSTQIEVYNASNQKLWTVSDCKSPYFINHHGQCYLVVISRTDIIFRDMTGAIVATCSTKYGPASHNVIMTINHIQADKDAGVQWDCFILEVYCYGYGSTPDVGKGGRSVRGIVTLDQAYPVEGPSGYITLTRHQFDMGRKCFYDISNTYHLNDMTVANLQSDCANWDYETMWQQLCNNMWHRNTKSPLRLLMTDANAGVDVTYPVDLGLLDATSVMVKERIGEDNHTTSCAYTRHAYNLMLDVADADDLLQRLKLLLFISGDQNPAFRCSPDDICMDQTKDVQYSYIIQFDDTEIKLKLECQLTTSEDDSEWYVYDSRVCRITALFAL